MYSRAEYHNKCFFLELADFTNFANHKKYTYKVVPLIYKILEFLHPSILYSIFIYIQQCHDNLSQ